MAIAASAVGAADLPAFPGAQGYGAVATGWRGGQVMRVTTLDDAGPGSLRACAEGADTPRVCIFDISGTISVDRPIFVSSNRYIAGQTAPGQGIQIRLGASRNTPLVIKNVHDVVVRFLKLRPGPSQIAGPSVDGVTVENGERIMLDHLSVMFATDENVNVHVSNSVAGDITLSNSIVAWGLDRSNHPKGRHSKGALICSDEGPKNDCGRISLIGNLFAHNRDRNPDLKATDHGPVEVINNIFYDAISQFGEFYDLLGDTDISYVGNLALAGPSTNRRAPEAVQLFDWEDGHTIALYAAGNRAERRRPCRRPRELDVLDAEAKRLSVDAPAVPLTVEPLDVDAAEARVMETAGARLPDGRFHDALDRAVLDNLRDCSGSVIDRVEEAGGWPNLPEERGAPDADGDGLPDPWEEAQDALDARVRDNIWAPAHPAGWSHLELWLAHLAGDEIAP
ncbi:pectate lyase family protein [Oceanomicrobium pacificus]|uniref:Pectate lyase n=1 Tax=Oceanomicrobium pacificus TaxID=2692916 RepID=A0A6B0TR87_9RHOB|nr:hypothetical protein [Oceanomicrobium pacificus]MXU65209.1 hypothetical protein [Oceanomicrobium pacificus]